MPSRIHIYEKGEMYFITCTIKNWYYIFDRHSRWNIISNVFKFYQLKRNLKLYGFVFMLNHIHYIAQCEDMIAFHRDFKKYTSKKLLENLHETEPTVHKLFLNKNKSSIWQTRPEVKIVYSESFYQQKLHYIHHNPVAKGYVLEPQDWYWSSANQFCELQAIERENWIENKT